MLGIRDKSKDQLIVQKTLAESTGDATTAAIYEAQLEVREDMGELKNVNMDEGSVGRWQLYGCDPG